MTVGWKCYNCHNTVEADPVREITRTAEVIIVKCQCPLCHIQSDVKVTIAELKAKVIQQENKIFEAKFNFSLN